MSKLRFSILGVCIIFWLQGCSSVGLKMPSEPLFVGDYAKIGVSIAGTGLTLDDIDFVIPDGPAAGEISLSPDASFDPAAPEAMLLVGHAPGSYLLDLRNKTTNDLLAEGKFEVNAQWPDDLDGPGIWFAGVLPQSGGIPGAAWGGGPPGVPQNFNVMPAIGTRQVNIVLIDTSTKRYTTDASEIQAIKDEWLNEAQDATESSANYYNEVSYGQFGLSVAVFGPVELTGPWEDYFDAVEHPQGGEVWRPANDFYQACATAADDLIDFASGQSLVCVSQSIDDEKFAWAYARGTTVSTAEGTVSIGGISMPFDWEVVDGRPIHRTLSHELGHNLGLSDLYTPELFMNNPPTQKRNVGAWDIMGSSGPLPHLALPQRMALGWIDQDDIELFNFQEMPPPVDETVSLHAMEMGSPPGGRRLGAEIRVADGWNYYFEYRDAQSGQIGDQDLPTNNRVFGSDVVSSPYTPPVARPPILLFDNDPDGDGSVLANNRNYREVDATDPMFPTDFTVTASSFSSNKADIRVQYGVFSKPDPYIRPWPASEDRQWQSPDIEVKNMRNAAEADWFNVPWSDHDNTIVATVTNGGNLDAENVEVTISEKNFNLGGAPVVTVLGTVVKDIPALGKVDFEVPWIPSTGSHYCISAVISNYTSPGGINETSSSNNTAQSNYTRFISASASPPTREMTTVDVRNPFDEPTRVFIIPSQTNPFYRTYLQHRWLMLGAGETKTVEIMFEFAPDAAQKATEQPNKEFIRIANDVRFASYIEDPRLMPIDAADLFSGAQVEVVTGRATEFQRFEAKRESVVGFLATKDNGQAVPGKIVILRVLSHNDELSYQVVPFTAGGFETTISKDWKQVTAYYPGRTNFGESTSKTVSADN